MSGCDTLTTTSKLEDKADLVTVRTVVKQSRAEAAGTTSSYQSRSPLPFSQ